MTLYELVQQLLQRVGDLEERWPKAIPTVEPVVFSMSQPPPLEDPEPCSCDEVVMLKADLREACRLLEVSRHKTDPVVLRFLARARVASQDP